MKLRLRSKSVGCLRAAPLIFALGSLGSAATYYVDPGGNDANPGSSSAPFRTVAKGVSVAAPGDTVILNNGTYGNEGHISDGSGGMSGYAAPVTISSSGAPGAYITVKAANTGQAILDCGTTSSSLGCDKYIYLNGGANYWTFEGLVFTRGAYGGIGNDAGASYINVLNCQFYNIGNWVNSVGIGEAGIEFYGSSTNWYIDGNIFHDIGRTGGLSIDQLDHGIYAGGNGVIVSNNIFYNLNKGSSIQIHDGQNWQILNNTFAFPPSEPYNGHLNFWGTLPNMTVRNNIFFQAGNQVINTYQVTMSNCLVDSNIVYPATALFNSQPSTCSVSNTLNGNPNLTNTSTTPYNFQPQAGGAGIDTGVNLSAVPTDMVGVTRPQGVSTDIGAYEFVAANAPAISGVFTSGVTTNSAIISWGTNQPATSSVQYGPTNTYSNTTPVSSTMVTSHSMSLSGLAASSTYHFRVASANSASQTSYSPDATFTTAAPAFSFGMSPASSSLSVQAGQSTGTNLTATLLTGTPVTVNLSASGLPAGASASFSSTSCLPTCTSALTVTTASSTPAGTYNISVLGSSSSFSTSAILTVTITSAPAPPLPPTSSPAPSAGNITTGLAAWWKFNEGTGNQAYDYSGNGNTATLNNSTWWTSNYGVTARFNGSQSYGAVNESPSLQLGNQMTVAFWVRASANSNVDPRIIAKAYDWNVKLNGSNRYPQLSIGGSSYAMMNYSLPLRTWTHIVFTFSNGVVTGYVNGVQVPMLANTFNSSTTIPTDAYGLFIAVTDPALNNAYIGSLDDVRIYNRALSAADVGTLHNFLQWSTTTAARR
jgi:hypothetical protein